MHYYDTEYIIILVNTDTIRSLSIPENSLHEIYSVRLSLRNGLEFGIEILCTGNVCRGPVLDTPCFELLLIPTVEDRSATFAY